MGMLRTIDTGSWTAKELKQYSDTHADIAPIRSMFGRLNTISITNMSLTINLMCKLDGSVMRQVFVPGGSIISLTEQDFRSFDLQNTTSNTSAGDEIYVMVGWEPATSKTVLSGLR
jgi:hypothetical protein